MARLIGIRATRWFALMAAIAVLAAMGGAGIRPAHAEYKQPGPAAVDDWFRGTALRRQRLKSPGPGIQHWKFNSWRVTNLVIYTKPQMVRLSVFTNGLYEQKWPYVQILDSVIGSVCGIRATGLGKRLLERMYRSKMLIKGEQLGGNAGQTFRKRVWLDRNGCLIFMTGNGARWHTVTTVIMPAR